MVDASYPMALRFALQRLGVVWRNRQERFTAINASPLPTIFLCSTACLDSWAVKKRLNSRRLWHSASGKPMTTPSNKSRLGVFLMTMCGSLKTLNVGDVAKPSNLCSGMAGLWASRPLTPVVSPRSCSAKAFHNSPRLLAVGLIPRIAAPRVPRKR